MAGNGRHAGGRKTKDTRDAVRSDGKLGGFELPDASLYLGPDETEWHPATVAWWDAWRASPQAVLMMTEPDWHFLLETALIHHTMWKNGRWEFASEVRMRTAKLGATPADRKALRLDIEIPEVFPVGETKATPDNMVSINDRRGRLTA